MATHSSSWNAPLYFDGTNYRYWKIRMRAHLKSKGLSVWEITQDATYAIPPNRVSQEEKDKYFAKPLFSKT